MMWILCCNAQALLFAAPQICFWLTAPWQNACVKLPWVVLKNYSVILIWGAMCYRWLRSWSCWSLSEDSKSVLTDQLWSDSKNEDRARIHHFSAPKPGVSSCAAPHINAKSSPLDYFQLAFTNESLILIESNRYYQQYIHGQVDKLNNQIFLITDYNIF